MADLTTLTAVKKYLQPQSSNQDPLIEDLIARESRLVEQFTSRRFPTVTNTAKRLNGTGGQVLVLPDSPILSVSLVQIGNTVIPASADGIAYGYTFDDLAIYLVGACFPRGRQNVTVTWTAGWRDSETDFISTDTEPTLTPTTGGAAANPVSVVSAAGVTFTQVGSGPAAHQYSFSEGVFTFSSADAGAEVTMTYDYVPGPVAQAVIEMIGLDLQQRTNMGINSKTLGGETITYSDRGMSNSVKEMLNPYRRLAPV